jgi:hypothetical protein
VLDGRHYSCVSGNQKQAFPKLRAIVKQDCLGHAADTDRNEPPAYAAALLILRDTSLGTISSILKHPLWWSCASDEKLQTCVRGISRIGIAVGATLSSGDSTMDNPWKPYRNPNLSVKIEKDEEPSPAETERITTSLEAIRMSMLSSELEVTLPQVEFCIDDTDPAANLDIWISQVGSSLVYRKRREEAEMSLKDPGMVDFETQTQGGCSNTVRRT